MMFTGSFIRVFGGVWMSLHMPDHGAMPIDHAVIYEQL